MSVSTEDALLLLQRIVALEDIIAQYRHTEQSLRARLTELENLVGKVPTSLVADQSES